MELASCPQVFTPASRASIERWKQGLCPRPEAPDLSPYPAPASPELSKLVNEIGGGG